MPRSKRDRQVTLSKVKSKKNMDFKNNKITEIRNEIPNYKFFFTFTLDNARNTVLKQLRLDWANDSRFFQTKRNLIKMAFGKNENTEVLKNLSKFADRINGNVGLLMTNKPMKEIESLIDNYNEYDYARAGSFSIATVIIKKGPLNDFVTHSEEPYLRTKLELPVKLDRGIVHLLQDHKICNFKQILSANQALQLKTFKIKLSEFRINLDAMYDSSTHTIVEFEKKPVKSRLLDHLSYNTIEVEEGDYKYTWNDNDKGIDKNETMSSGIEDMSQNMSDEDMSD